MAWHLAGQRVEAVWRCTTSHHGPRRYVAKITRVFGEVDTAYWFEGSAVAPTVRNVVDHARLMLTVDLSYPVILGHDGRVMDGMHRIARALLDGVAEVSAVRFPSLPDPDYRNIQPDQLTY